MAGDALPVGCTMDNTPWGYSIDDRLGRFSSTRTDSAEYCVHEIRKLDEKNANEEDVQKAGKCRQGK
jgi:hypothetical protein